MQPNWSLRLPYNTINRASILQKKKSDPLDKSKLSAIEQSLPTRWGWFNTQTGKNATGMNVEADPLNRWQEQVIYPNDLAREKIQEQWNNSPLQYATNPDGTVTASRSINSAYSADGISRGQALNYKWILPQQSIGATFRQQNNPETDAQRSMMYDRGGAYSNTVTDVSPYRTTSASFRLPTTRSGAIGAQFGGITNYATGQQYSAAGLKGLGGFSSLSIPAQYTRFRGLTTPELANYGEMPQMPAGKKSAVKYKGQVSVGNPMRRFGLTLGRNY